MVKGERGKEGRARWKSRRQGRGMASCEWVHVTERYGRGLLLALSFIYSLVSFSRNGMIMMTMAMGRQKREEGSGVKTGRCREDIPL